MSPNRELRIALIQATGGDSRSYGLPLAIGYLAAYLRAHAETISPSLDILPTESLDEVLDFKPDLVGISSVTSCFNHATAMAVQVKQATAARVIGGGHHVSALPHRLPDCFDAAVIGEGEETLCELLAATTQGGWTPQVLSGVKGIAYRDGGSIVVNERRPLITPLDSLPYPLRTANPTQPDEATIFTSRGCPYTCIFCSSCRHWGRFRAFSAEYVVGEIEHVLRASPAIERFYSLDDLFIVPRERLRRIVELLEQRGLASRLRFRGFVRSNLVDEECCELLARMNFRQVRFGAESASPRVLERLKLGTTSVEEHQRCIDLCSQHGFSVGASYMLGNPGETEEDLRLTYDFIARNKGKSYVDGFYLLMPLPGTPVWDDCLRRGVVSEDMDWSRLNVSFDNPDFDWDNFIYANDAMSRADFVASVRNYGMPIRDEVNSVIAAQVAATAQEAADYLPAEPASHHTRERNTLVFTSEDQLREEHQNHPARYRFCAARLSPTDVVLDCACGCGYGAIILADKCARVVGVELHQDLIDFARRCWSRPNVEYLAFDVSAGPLPFPDNSFSAVVSLETIEHVPDGPGLLREFRRVVRPGGLLMLSTPQAPMGNPHHVREYTLGELCREVEQAGFPVAETVLQRMGDDFVPGAAPETGWTNLLVAGRPTLPHPLALVVDDQSARLREMREETGGWRAHLARIEAESADMRTQLESHIAALEAQFQRLANHWPNLLYHRVATSAPYRLLRRLLKRR